VIRRGAVVTGFYAAVLVVLLLPAWAALTDGKPKLHLDVYSDWAPWVWVTVLVVAQALLLFLSVDESQPIPRRRRHLASTAALAGFLTMVLFASAALALWVAFQYDASKGLENPVVWSLIALAGMWLAWAGLFYAHYRGSSRPVDAAVRWLVRGSILELLVAVPSHVVVHRRNECTEPAVTAYGVVTGLALMLLAFGPGVLALYRKRIDERRARMRRARA
jgi:hypothetical protein